MRSSENREQVISDQVYAELLAEREQLLHEKDENNEILVSCKAQIDAAKARAEEDGSYADPVWFAKVNTRARYAGLRDQEIAHRLSEIKKIQRQRWEEKHVASSENPDEVRQLLISALQLIQRAVDLLKARDEG